MKSKNVLLLEETLHTKGLWPEKIRAGLFSVLNSPDKRLDCLTLSLRHDERSQPKKIIAENRNFSVEIKGRTLELIKNDTKKNMRDFFRKHGSNPYLESNKKECRELHTSGYGAKRITYDPDELTHRTFFIDIGHEFGHAKKLKIDRYNSNKIVNRKTLKRYQKKELLNILEIQQERDARYEGIKMAKEMMDSGYNVLDGFLDSAQIAEYANRHLATYIISNFPYTKKIEADFFIQEQHIQSILGNF